MPVPGDDPLARAAAYVREHRDEPYVFGSSGPGGYDCSGFLRPTDWTAWIKRDRVGAIRALLAIELRYRGRRALELLRSRLSHREDTRRRFTR